MKKEGGDHLVSLLECLVLPAGVLCATFGTLVPLVSASLALKGLLATKSQKS